MQFSEALQLLQPKYFYSIYLIYPASRSRAGLDAERGGGGSPGCGSRDVVSHGVYVWAASLVVLHPRNVDTRLLRIIPYLQLPYNMGVRYIVNMTYGLH